MKTMVVFNDDLHLKNHLNEFEKIGEEEVVATAEEVASIVGGTLLPVREVAQALEILRRERPGMVFNLCEGVAGRPGWEMHFALALEMLGLPFTGADPTAIGICNDKALTKKLLAGAGVPVPEDYRAGAGGGPWIVKPSREDAGIGIEPAAVCTTPADVERRAAWVRDTYRQPAVIEEFIDGPEFNQALYDAPAGLVVLPPGEIVFAGHLARSERLVGWKAKWAEGSEEDRATVSRTPADIAAPLREELAALGRRAAAVLGVGGPCRFDIRRRPSGELCLLDANPNPDIGRGSGFRKALEAAGTGFEDFLEELMMAALSRRRP